MRFEELVHRTPDDELRIRFHEQLTVLSGIGLLERQALTESLLAAAAGTADGAVLTVRDRTGRLIEIVSEAGLAVARYTDDGSSAPLLLGTVAQSLEELRALVVVQAPDLGLSATKARGDDDPELVEARATLAELARDLHAATAERGRQHGLREELAAIEAKLQNVQDDEARRAYAKVLYELERVRAEAATFSSGATGAETDRHLLTAADPARAVARRWQAASDALTELNSKLGRGERLDAATLAAVCRYPASVPANLRDLQDELDTARLNRDRLDRRLRELATSTLPEPSDPRIVSLATADQAMLWEVRDQLVAADRAVQREQLALGGPGADEVTGGDAASITARLEEAQHEVDAAEAVRQRQFVPSVATGAISALLCLMLGASSPVLGLVMILVAGAIAVVGIGKPMRQKAAAERSVRRVLVEAGADSYLGFHLRRVDAAVNRKAGHGLEAALLERRTAANAWNELVPGIDTTAATELEAEARHYAAEVAKLGDSASGIEALRAELIGTAEPALAAARAALIAACAPYGVDEDAIDSTDASLVDRLVQAHVVLGARGRVQVALETAEAKEREVAAELDGLLASIGFGDGELSARVGALDWAIDHAMEREQARIKARPQEEVEADRERLEEQVRRMRRPEWASVQPSVAAGEAEDELLQRAEELRAAIAADDHTVIDLERVADRHSAMERRVASLEAANTSGPTEASVIELADVHQYLLAHLTKAGHAGPFDESVPVVLDDAFLHIAAERKWELLDMLRRLGEKTQLLYLTDDPFVSAWARRRSAAGLVTLLEPVDA